MTLVVFVKGDMCNTNENHRVLLIYLFWFTALYIVMSSSQSFFSYRIQSLKSLNVITFEATNGNLI